MKKLRRIIATAVVSLGLSVPGLVVADTGTINTTGPGSDNTISSTTDLNTEVDNHNDLDVDATVDQSADSGEAWANNNTTVGDVGTGDASNSSSLSVSLAVDNSASSSAALSNGGNGGGSNSGTIGTTGPTSDNHISFDYSSNVEVDNRNDIDVDTNVDQTASSGEAHASGNTTVGNVTTGNASNTSTLQYTLNVTN